MQFLGMHILDIVVILAYFGIVVGIGLKVMRKISTQEDYFLGGRQFNQFFQTFSQFGQATSSEGAVNAVAVVGMNGVTGGIQQTVNGIFSYPLAWLFPKWLRRSRLMSMAGYFTQRFHSRRLAGLYAIAQACMFLMVGGMGLYATSTTIRAITEKPLEALTVEERAEYDLAQRLSFLSSQPLELLSAAEQAELDTLRDMRPSSHFSYLNRTALIIVIAVIVFLYAVAGGLEAAVYTDTMQGIFILLLTVMLVPFGMSHLNTMHGTSGLLGPFEALHRVLPGNMLEIFGAPGWVEFTWYNILLLGFMGMAGNIAFSNNLVVAAAARTDKVASYGGLSGLLMRGASQVFWIVLALLIIGLFGESTGDPDLLFGQAAQTLLPVGLLGLMIACLAAAFMSSADMHMMTVSGLLTHDIYKPLVPNRSETHYVTVGRILTLVYIIGAVLFAIHATNVFRMLKFMILINLCCGPAMLMGFVWRRTNAAAVWASMGTALMLTIVIPSIVMIWPGARYNETLLMDTRSPLVEKRYIAGEHDVTARLERIEQWERMNAEGLATTARPEPLAVGDPFVQTYAPQSRAVFWDNDFRVDDQGRRYGHGFFKPELWIMYKLGVNLEAMTPSRVEMLSLIFRLIFPFAAVILVGFLTPPMEKRDLDAFYAKQRTPVHPDPEEDRKAVQATIDDPARFDHEKLWPGSDWEFGKLQPFDAKGLSVALLVGLSYIALVIGISRLGRG